MASRTSKTQETEEIKDTETAADNPTPDTLVQDTDVTNADPVEGAEASDADNAANDNMTTDEANAVHAVDTPTVDTLVQQQQDAEAEAAKRSANVPKDMHEVRFSVAHTLGAMVYAEGQTAVVPKDHPFYGMSPKEQEEKYGAIQFMPVK